MKKAIYWLIVALVPVVFLALMYAIDREPGVDPQWLHPVVLSVVGDDDEPPPFLGPVVVEQELPDAQLRPFPGAASGIWYQFVIEKPSQARGLWGLFLPWVNGNLSMYINGALAGESAPMRRPFPEYRKPLYFEFPAALLGPGKNTIQIRVVSERGVTWFTPFYFGPSQELKPAYLYTHFLQFTLMAGTVVALGVVSILLLGLFWIRRCDTGNGWFAAATIAWALYNWILIEPRLLIPIPGVWFSLPPIALGWFTICSAHFVNRLPGCKRPPRWVEHTLMTFGVVGSIMLMAHNLAGGDQPWVQNYVWFPGVMLISAYIVWQLIRATLRNPNLETRLWLCAAALALVVGVRDYLWDQNITTSGTFHYLSYTVSFVLISLAITLLSRVSRALTETETLNLELEDRVAAKGAELAQNYERLRILERQQTISSERERMTTDMHDGIGGQLVHALAVIENNPQFQPMEPILRGALDDLRLIIDSADPMEGDLLVVLSNFRARNERRVQAGGLHFLWQVSDLPSMPDFGPHKILQVLRILQEALTNVLKHAQATQVTVRTSTATDAGGVTVIVDVIDDGTGFVAGNVSGRGLGNMRRRAQELGGSVDLSATEKGSRLRLILPVVDRRHIAR
ncbi:MAG: ATP-binding protein [Pseudomonadota bacterium]